jgi:membrane protease YdiL (CAAX protease family)
MMRQRWVLWRTAAAWGVAVGALQTLASINEFPLIWMTYDTAVPRATFIAQQAALLVAGFVGFSVFFTLSFMAAETLSRRAFGPHPQFWRAWSREAGPSVQILGRTGAGYLLVAVFFAYDVILYVVMTKVFGWWSPAEALVHPDVLATYAPWLSAIANSFQAGFWEEALFRAVPIAGAALIGDRFGKRRLFIVIAFVVQAIVFGAGHAPYPNQPAYARPVELIIPSIGFGLLYLYFGLLPGIVLHFAFDVVWFALPIFLAKAPGIWFQQIMVAALTLVPLWIVLVRRARMGRWIELPPHLRNAAWTPPPADTRVVEPHAAVHHALGPRARVAWLIMGVASIAALAATLAWRASDRPYGTLPLSRAEAERSTRAALTSRGVTLAPNWRVMPVPDDGSGGAHQFVYETAGEARWRELLGVYLPKARWRVRVATFEGDVVDRAEEWRVFVNPDGEVRSVQHVIPEGRAGASLDEAAARGRATQAVQQRYGLDLTQVKEVSAKPAKQKARTDWTFTFADQTIVPLPQGEPRIDVTIAGDEVTSVSRYVYVPEEWQRQQRAASTRSLVIQIASSIVFGGLLIAAAIGGMIAWSRRCYAPRVFLFAAAIAIAASLAGLCNGWRVLLASLPTTAPLQLALIGVIAVAGIGLAMLAAMVGLAMGALPPRLAGLGRIGERDALPLGAAAGVFGAALTATAAALRTPPWAHYAPVDSVGAIVPALDIAIDPIAGFMTTLAVILTALIAVDRFTASWTRRHVAGVLALAAIGFLSGGAPVGAHLGGWALAGLLVASGLVIVYVTLLRFDPTLVPVALGAMAVVRAVAIAVQRPFPGAAAGTALAVVVTALLSWGWFRVLRRVV